VPGDLEDVASLTDDMRGCRTVFHVAGLNAMCLRDPSPLFRSNVDGAANVVWFSQTQWTSLAQQADGRTEIIANDDE
jgi:hypothetical protein